MNEPMTLQQIAEHEGVSHQRIAQILESALRKFHKAFKVRGFIMNDPVNHPKHYVDHPSGIECIQITEHMGFNLGNAVKYIWRCDLKKDAIEDLKKAVWYLQREIAKREKNESKSSS
jgi:hypothetical protein